MAILADIRNRRLKNYKSETVVIEPPLLSLTLIMNLVPRSRAELRQTAAEGRTVALASREAVTTAAKLAPKWISKIKKKNLLLKFF